MRMTSVLLGILLCLGVVRANDAAKKPYDELGTKIRNAVETKKMPEASKQEILTFWKTYMEYHKSNQIDTLVVTEIKIGPRVFKIELKDKRPYLNIEGHTIPLIIKGKNYIFTTGDVVYKKGQRDDYTLEVYPIVKDNKGFTVNRKTIKEVSKIIKP